MRYSVTATAREKACDRSAPIKSLKLDQNFNGFGLHAIQDLRILADAGQLWVKRGFFDDPARVRIFWAAWLSRWIATTNPDETVCNNLLSLPIYYPTRTNAEGVISFEACPL